MTMMNESEFNRRVDEVLLRIEEAVEQSGVDIDYENVSGILTLAFDDDSQIIINRQTPARQLWVAARDGGYHFDFDPEKEHWVRDTDGQELFSLLERACADQAGEEVRF
jgi:CyaY protein